MKSFHPSEPREHLLLALIALATYLVSSRFDFLEKIVSFSQTYEAYEVDELVTVCIVLVFIQAILLHRKWIALRHEKKRLEQEHLKLKAAMQEIKQLKGIIPICASCKKIRDDDGYWHQVETYLSAHSEAQFSHGLCPECMESLYGDVLDETS
ncbi:hypothetical protein [Desulfoluna sp.]|uniref:hypothetical protein n=1 Tax=Desulfoluna sp. TaxID=2045199 RepID=UPI002628B648|nr:hypothetical protein [Desulfoluna sp.]